MTLCGIPAGDATQGIAPRPRREAGSASGAVPADGETLILLPLLPQLQGYRRFQLRWHRVWCPFWERQGQIVFQGKRNPSAPHILQYRTGWLAFALACWPWRTGRLVCRAWSIEILALAMDVAVHGGIRVKNPLLRGALFVGTSRFAARPDGTI